jgi:hypothetical protein
MSMGMNIIVAVGFIIDYKKTRTMKTAVEKAEWLFNEYYQKVADSSSPTELAKKCALIAVDEIIELLEDNGLTFTEYQDRTTIEYWLQVKQELNKSE